MKTLIYGAGATGLQISRQLQSTREIIGFLDSDPSKWGEKCGDIPDFLPENDWSWRNPDR